MSKFTKIILLCMTLAFAGSVTIIPAFAETTQEEAGVKEKHKGKKAASKKAHKEGAAAKKAKKAKKGAHEEAAQGAEQ